MNRLHNGSWSFLRLFIYLYSFILNIVLLEIFFLFTHFQPQTYISIYIKEHVKMSICNLLTFNGITDKIIYYTIEFVRVQGWFLG